METRIPMEEGAGVVRTYISEVITRKIIPAALASGIAAIGSFLVAHSEKLKVLGITYWQGFGGVFPAGQVPTGDIIVIEFDTIQKWGATALVMAVGAVMSWLTHHSVATVTGAPQSGDKRTEPTAPIVGGDRKEDLPKEIK